MIKAAFFDIDGTLLSRSTGTVPESAVEAVKTLQRQGVSCVLATGRNWTELASLELCGLRFDGFITADGHFCLDGSFKPFFEKPIEHAKPIIELFNEKKYPVLLVLKEEACFNFADDALRSLMRRSANRMQVKEYTGDPIYQAAVFVEKGADKELLERLSGLKVLRWGPRGIDVISEDMDKSVGMREYMKLHGISQSETIAFGDSENDIGMLQEAGIGVALGNAYDEVKAQADFVTKHIDDDGIAFALKELRIIV